MENIDYYSNTFNYSRPTSLLHREEKVIEILNRGFPKKAKFLDVGSGAGVLLKYIKDNFKSIDVEGLDSSPDQISRCQKQGIKVKLTNLSEGIPHEDNSFDIVHCGEVIEHLYNPDFLSDEIYRVLKPGGTAIISTPNLSVWYNRIFFILGGMPVFMEASARDSSIGFGIAKKFKKGSTPVGHIRVMNKEAIEDILKNSGFSIKKISGATFEALPNFMNFIEKFVLPISSMQSILVVEATK